MDNSGFESRFGVSSYHSTQQFTNRLERGSLRSAEYLLKPSFDAPKNLPGRQLISNTVSAIAGSEYKLYRDVGGELIYNVATGDPPNYTDQNRLRTQAYTHQQAGRTTLLHSKFATGKLRDSNREVARIDTGGKFHYNLLGIPFSQTRHKDLYYETENPQMVKELKSYYKKLRENKSTDISGKYVKTGKNILESLMSDIQGSTGDVMIHTADFNPKTTFSDPKALQNSRLATQLQEQLMATSRSGRDVYVAAKEGRLRNEALLRQAGVTTGKRTGRNTHYNLFLVEDIGGTEEDVFYLTTRRLTGSPTEELGIRVSSLEDPEAYAFYKDQLMKDAGLEGPSSSLDRGEYGYIRRMTTTTINPLKQRGSSKYSTGSYVPYMPTQMDQSFFAGFRNKNLPSARMFKTRYEAITGKEASDAIITADAAIETPSIGERLNRTLGFEFYRRGEGLIGSTLRSTGRLLDIITGQRAEQKEKNVNQGDYIGTITKYKNLMYSDVTYQEGTFESVLSNIGQTALGFAIGIGSLSASLASNFVFADLQEQGLRRIVSDIPTGGAGAKRAAAFAFGLDVSVDQSGKMSMGKSDEFGLMRPLTVVNAYRRYEATVLGELAPAITSIITPDIEYIKDKQAAILFGGDSVKRFESKYGKDVTKKRDLANIVGVGGKEGDTGIKGLLNLIGQPIDIDFTPGAHQTSLGHGRVEALAKHIDLLAETIPFNPVYWIPGVRQMAGIDKLSAEEFESYSMKKLFGEMFLSRSITAFLGTFHAAVDLAKNPTARFKLAESLYKTSTIVEDRDNEIAKQLRALTSQYKTKVVGGEQLMQQELQGMIQHTQKVASEMGIDDAIKERSRHLKNLQGDPYYKALSYNEGGAWDSYTNKIGNQASRMFIGIGALLLADFAADQLLFSQQGLDLHQQTSLFSAVRDEEGQALTIRFTPTMPALTSLVAAGLGATVAGKLLPAYEIVKGANTGTGKAFEELAEFLGSVGAKDEHIKLLSGMTKLNNLNAVKAKFNTKAAYVGGMIALLGAKAAYVATASALNTIHNREKRASLSPVHEMISSKFRTAMLASSPRTSDQLNKTVLGHLLKDMMVPQMEPSGGKTYSVASQFSLGFMQFTTVSKFDPVSNSGSLAFGMQLMPAFGTGFNFTLPIGIRTLRKKVTDREELGIDRDLGLEGEGLLSTLIGGGEPAFRKIGSIMSAPFSWAAYTQDNTTTAALSFLGAGAILGSGVSVLRKGAQSNTAFGYMVRKATRDFLPALRFTDMAVGSLYKGVQGIAGLGYAIPTSMGKGAKAFLSQDARLRNMFSQPGAAKAGSALGKAAPYWLAASLAFGITDPFLGADAMDPDKGERSVYQNVFSRAAAIGTLSIGGVNLYKNLLTPGSISSKMPIIGSSVRHFQKALIESAAGGARPNIIRQGMARAGLMGVGFVSASLLSKALVRVTGALYGESGVENLYSTPALSFIRALSGIDSTEYSRGSRKRGSFVKDIVSTIPLGDKMLSSLTGLYRDMPNFFLPLAGTPAGFSLDADSGGVRGYQQLQAAGITDFNMAAYTMFNKLDAYSGFDPVVFKGLMDLDDSLIDRPGGGQLALAVARGGGPRKGAAKVSSITPYTMDAMRSSGLRRAMSIRSWYSRQAANQRAFEHRIDVLREMTATGMIADVGTGARRAYSGFNMMASNLLKVLPFYTMPSGVMKGSGQQMDMASASTPPPLDAKLIRPQGGLGPLRFPGWFYQMVDKISGRDRTIRDNEEYTRPFLAAYPTLLGIGLSTGLGVAYTATAIQYMTAIKTKVHGMGEAFGDYKVQEALELFDVRAKSRRFFSPRNVDDGVYFASYNRGMPQIVKSPGGVNLDDYGRKLQHVHDRAAKRYRQRLSGFAKAGSNVELDAIVSAFFDESDVAVSNVRNSLIDLTGKVYWDAPTMQVKNALNNGKVSIKPFEVMFNVDISGSDALVNVNDQLQSMVSEAQYKELMNKVKGWKKAFGNDRIEVERHIRQELIKIESDIFNTNADRYGQPTTHANDYLADVIDAGGGKARGKFRPGRTFTGMANALGMYYGFFTAAYGLAEGIAYMMDDDARTRKHAASSFVRVAGSELAAYGVFSLSQSMLGASGIAAMALAGLGYLGYEGLKGSKFGNLVAKTESAIGDALAGGLTVASNILAPITAPVGNVLQNVIFNPLGEMIHKKFNSSQSMSSMFMMSVFLPQSLHRVAAQPVSKMTAYGREPFIYGARGSADVYLSEQRKQAMKASISMNAPLDIVHPFLLGGASGYKEDLAYSLYFGYGGGRQGAGAVGKFGIQSMSRISNSQMKALRVRQELSNYYTHGATMRRNERQGSDFIPNLVQTTVANSMRMSRQYNDNIFSLMSSDYTKARYLSGKAFTAGTRKIQQITSSVTSPLLGRSRLGQMVKLGRVRKSISNLSKQMLKGVGESLIDMPNALFEGIKQGLNENSYVVKLPGKDLTQVPRAMGKYFKPVVNKVGEDYMNMGARVGTFGLEMMKGVFQPALAVAGDMAVPMLNFGFDVIASAGAVGAGLYNQVTQRVVGGAVKQLGRARTAAGTAAGGTYSQRFQSIRQRLGDARQAGGRAYRFSKKYGGKFLNTTSRIGAAVAPVSIDAYTLGVGAMKVGSMDSRYGVRDLFEGRTRKLINGQQIADTYSSQMGLAYGIFGGAAALALGAPVMGVLALSAGMSILGSKLGMTMAIEDIRQKTNENRNMILGASALAMFASAGSTFVSTYVNRARKAGLAGNKEFIRSRDVILRHESIKRAGRQRREREASRLAAAQREANKLNTQTSAEAADISPATGGETATPVGGSEVLETRRAFPSVNDGVMAPVPAKGYTRMTFFDIETGGLKTDDPLGRTSGTPPVHQIATVTYDIDLKTGEFYVDPQTGQRVARRGEAFMYHADPMSHFTDDYTPAYEAKQVSDPWNPTTVPDTMKAAGMPDTGMLIGHNVKGFDIPVLVSELRKGGFDAQADLLEQQVSNTFDTYLDVDAEAYFELGVGDRKLESTADAIRPKGDGVAHNATVDVQNNAEAFSEMIKRGVIDPDRIPGLSVEERQQLKDIYKSNRDSYGAKTRPVEQNPTGTIQHDGTTDVNGVRPGSGKIGSSMISAMEAADVLDKVGVSLMTARSTVDYLFSSLRSTSRDPSAIHARSAMLQASTLGLASAMFSMSAPSRILAMGMGYLMGLAQVDLTFGLASRGAAREQQRMEDHGVYGIDVSAGTLLNLGRDQAYESMGRMPTIARSIGKVLKMAGLNRSSIHTGMKGVMRFGVGYGLAKASMSFVFGPGYTAEEGYSGGQAGRYAREAAAVATGAAAMFGPKRISEMFSWMSRPVKELVNKSKVVERAGIITVQRDVPLTGAEQLRNGNNPIGSSRTVNSPMRRFKNFLTGRVNPQIDRVTRHIKRLDNMMMEGVWTAFGSRGGGARIVSRSIVGAMLFGSVAYALDKTRPDGEKLFKNAGGLAAGFVGAGVAAGATLLGSNSILNMLSKRTGRSRGRTARAVGRLGGSAVVGSISYGILSGMMSDKDPNRDLIAIGGGVTIGGLHYGGSQLLRSSEKFRTRIGTFGRFTGSNIVPALGLGTLGYLIGSLLDKTDKNRDPSRKGIPTQALIGMGIGAGLGGTFTLANQVKSRVMMSTKFNPAISAGARYGSALLIGAGVGYLGGSFINDDTGQARQIGAVVGAGVGVGAMFAGGRTASTLMRGVGGAANTLMAPLAVGLSGAEIVGGANLMMTNQTAAGQAAGYSGVLSGSYALMNMLAVGTSLTAIPTSIVGGMYTSSYAAQRGEQLAEIDASGYETGVTMAGDLATQIKFNRQLHRAYAGRKGIASFTRVRLNALRRGSRAGEGIRVGAMMRRSAAASTSTIGTRALNSFMTKVGRLVPGKVSAAARRGTRVLTRGLKAASKFGRGALKVAGRVFDVAEYGIASAEVGVGGVRMAGLDSSSTDTEIDYAYEMAGRGTGRAVGTAVSGVAAKGLYALAGGLAATGVGLPIAGAVFGAGLAIDIFGSSAGAAIGGFLSKNIAGRAHKDMIKREIRANRTDLIGEVEEKDKLNKRDREASGLDENRVRTPGFLNQIWRKLTTTSPDGETSEQATKEPGLLGRTWESVTRWLAPPAQAATLDAVQTKVGVLNNEIKISDQPMVSASSQRRKDRADLLTNIGSSFGGFLQWMAEKARAAMVAAGNFFKGMFRQARGFVGGMMNYARRFGRGLISRVRNWWDKLKNAASNLFSGGGGGGTWTPSGADVYRNNVKRIANNLRGAFGLSMQDESAFAITPPAHLGTAAGGEGGDVVGGGSIMFPVPGANAMQRLPGPGGMMNAMRDGGTRRHNGIDYLYSTGTPLVAPFSGTVREVYSDRGEHGTKIVGVDDQGRQLVVHLNHLATIKLKPGQQVTAGQSIGTVGGDKGSWGSTGSHLDLKMQVDGKFVDPRTFFGDKTTPKAGAGGNVAVPQRTTNTATGPTTGRITTASAQDILLLETIAGPESGGKYNARYPGTTFSGYSDHPRIRAPITSGPNRGKYSTAAGRYQFIDETWDDMAKQVGVTDFTPVSQDKAAIGLLRNIKAHQALASGNLPQLRKILAGQWEAFALMSDAQFAKHFRETQSRVNAGNFSIAIAQQQSGGGTRQPTTATAPQSSMREMGASNTPSSNALVFGSLNKSYQRLGEIQRDLSANSYFDPNTASGRGALSVAMIISAGEVGDAWLSSGSGVNLYTARGGAGNNMRGFAQFNLAYFNQQTSSKKGYADLLGQMLTGSRSLPTGRGKFDPNELVNLVKSGEISTEQQLLSYIQRKISIMDWHGLHESGGGGNRIRQSGVLTEALAYLKGAEAPTSFNAGGGAGGGGGGGVSIGSYYSTNLTSTERARANAKSNKPNRDAISMVMMDALRLEKDRLSGKYNYAENFVANGGGTTAGASGTGGSGGSVGVVGGAFGTGTYSAGGGRQGSGTPYHGDISFGNISSKEKVELMDNLIRGYEATGRTFMILSGYGEYSGKSWNPDAPMEKKLKDIEFLLDSHWNSRRAIDYYIVPKGTPYAGGGTKGVENQEFMLPHVEGGKVTYKQNAGAAGHFVQIFKDGKLIVQNMHGDTSRPSPQSRTLSGGGGGATPPVNNMSRQAAQNLPGTRIEVVNTSRKTSAGIYVLEVRFIQNGKLVHKAEAVSGRANTWNLDRNVANKQAPAPDGIYKWGRDPFQSTIADVGGQFVDIIPTFNTGRSALGFHYDAGEPGTAGCIGFIQQADRDYLVKFARQNKSAKTYVDINPNDNFTLQTGNTPNAGGGSQSPVVGNPSAGMPSNYFGFELSENQIDQSMRRLESGIYDETSLRLLKAYAKEADISSELVDLYIDRLRLDGKIHGSPGGPTSNNTAPDTKTASSTATTTESTQSKLSATLPTTMEQISSNRNLNKIAATINTKEEMAFSKEIYDSFLMEAQRAINLAYQTNDPKQLEIALAKVKDAIKLHPKSEIAEEMLRNIEQQYVPQVANKQKEHNAFIASINGTGEKQMTASEAAQYQQVDYNQLLEVAVVDGKSKFKGDSISSEESDKIAMVGKQRVKVVVTRDDQPSPSPTNPQPRPREQQPTTDYLIGASPEIGNLSLGLDPQRDDWNAIANSRSGGGIPMANRVEPTLDSLALAYDS